MSLDSNTLPKGKKVDPENTTKTNSRVIRGGSWYSYPLNFRAACRGKNAPDYRGVDGGLRVVVLSGEGVN